ncbi:wax ester/triacylglycerol synthase domain-containing protein [Alteromonas gilva]|uniref:diacylglycerol O-acyltransferase n=1 Tax=Alteromonas gilva TaxID=2987522 RepID=A0ABT5L2G9_9ALTE|nr:wax ester/triacylglycerol synthase domain-containing protein [Alteromonas gilva]MDC8830619.1 wax ester/triacylglycerol synthase family O-acyltransferase [Alteromonas gilva]
MGQKLSFLDRSFWITETKANPKHVGCLQLLEMPEGSDPETYIKALHRDMQSFARASPPFNCRVKAFYIWPIGLQPVKHMHMDYHVQYHQVDVINERPALDDFVARMHETRLDPDKPLWQYHFLYSPGQRLFAIYARVHHLYGDGSTLVRWFQAGYQDAPQPDAFVPLWAVKRLRHRKRRQQFGRLKGYWLATKDAVLSAFDLAAIFIRLLLRLLRINRHYMPVPFTGTKTVLTGQVKPGRAVATFDLDFARIRKLARRTRASANEVLLTAIDIGMHRLLQDHGQLFTQALYTNMPINLRKPGEKTTGNRIAIVPVQLAHAESDPYLRLRQIIYHHRIVKHAAQRARPSAFSNYTIVIQACALVFEWLHISDWVKPIANVLVSNIPGPKRQKYFKDSKLLACYPISTMTPGGGVNVTIMTYNGTANVGLVCCNSKIKSLQPLAEYCREAFDMLEASIDDPTLSIDDIGEHTSELPLSIVSDH